MKQEFPTNFKEYFLTEGRPGISQIEKETSYEDALNAGVFKTTDDIKTIALKMGWEKRPANVSDAERGLGIQRRPGQTRDRSKKTFYKEGTFVERLNKIGKRDHKVRNEKLASFGNDPVYCEVCGFYPLDERFNEIYPNVNEQNYLSMFDVHHIKDIAEGERYTDPIEDTIVVCGNCHATAPKEK